ncbi:plasmid mobilization relaxosome protein MobC [Escherichia coli]|nr:plasmid mobilization relaxosome protein MobC [Escherichia coli]
MIVKFHARGKGGGSGPVDYLLGRERNREGATVLQGNPEEVRELIDATPFAKKYTSGVLSFAEKELPPGGREKVMASFERVLMPGLEKNQYSILWVEHQDKGRLELNFVIPNMELQTGKRLQPYYDREHARLLERCEGKQLAVWMRRVCLGEPVARSGKLPTLAQPLLRQLAAIGNNLNQTARKVNSGQWSSGDRVQVVAALMAIGDELRRLRLAVREQGARDDS